MAFMEMQLFVSINLHDLLHFLLWLAHVFIEGADVILIDVFFLTASKR